MRLSTNSDVTFVKNYSVHLAIWNDIWTVTLDFNIFNAKSATTKRHTQIVWRLIFKFTVTKHINVLHARRNLLAIPTWNVIEKEQPPAKHAKWKRERKCGCTDVCVCIIPAVIQLQFSSEIKIWTFKVPHPILPNHEKKNILRYGNWEKRKFRFQFRSRTRRKRRRCLLASLPALGHEQIKFRLNLKRQKSPQRFFKTFLVHPPSVLLNLATCK